MLEISFHLEVRYSPDHKLTRRRIHMTEAVRPVATHIRRLIVARLEDTYVGQPDPIFHLVWVQPAKFTIHPLADSHVGAKTNSTHYRFALCYFEPQKLRPRKSVGYEWFLTGHIRREPGSFICSCHDSSYADEPSVVFQRIGKDIADGESLRHGNGGRGPVLRCDGCK